MDNNMIEKLKSMLDDPDTVKALSDTISGIMPHGSGVVPDNSADTMAHNNTDAVQGAGDIPQADALSTLQDTLSRASNVPDPRINLLYSLKPYMRPSRSARMDQAIKLIQITKIASLLK